MKLLKLKVGVLIFGFTVLSSCSKKDPAAPATAAVQPAEIAPKPLKVYETEGIKVNAYDFDKLEYFLNKKTDTTYVVNFWATWCVPCVEELPHFERLNEEQTKNKVKVLLVSLDMHKMVESKMIPFIKEKKLQSDVVLLRDPDANSWIAKVDKSWTGAIPATLIYKGGNRKFYEKAFTYEGLLTEVESFEKSF